MNASSYTAEVTKLLFIQPRITVVMIKVKLCSPTATDIKISSDSIT